MARNENSNTTANINNGLATLDPAIFGIVGKNPKGFKVCLGGPDGEMTRIKNKLLEAGVELAERQPASWEAKASFHKDEIMAAIKAGKTPVLIELTPDIDLPEEVIVVDHHNENSSRPASILQVLHLLGMQPTREDILCAANDTGYILAMIAKGATAEEIAEVRLLDRSAQGITPEQEQEAERAIAAMEEINGVSIFRMSHSKTATVCDRLFDPEKEQRQLFLSKWEEEGEEKTEVNFYGKWALCEELYERYGEPGAWHTWKGGTSEGMGFFGSNVAPLDEVESFVVAWFAEK